MRLFLFLTWAIIHVSPAMLSFVCANLLADSVDELHATARLRFNTIAMLLDVTPKVCFFVLDSQASNELVVNAFCALCPALSLLAPYEKVENERTTVIRDIRRDLGDEDLVFVTPEAALPSNSAGFEMQPSAAPLSFSNDISLSIEDGLLFANVSVYPLEHKSEIVSKRRPSNAESGSLVKRPTYFHQPISVNDATPAPAPRDVRSQRLVAPLEESVESVNTRLPPKVWLNENVVNTALSRLASHEIGIIDSLAVNAALSSSLSERFNNLFTTNSIVHLLGLKWRVREEMTVSDESIPTAM
ncbi:hypothetical protein FAVG1_12848 [Fusarium avenaceum]|nr:hypothetical protein FAVG1_12848 [Fusarium avenaceum]